MMHTVFFKIVLALESALRDENKLADVVTHGKGCVIPAAVKTAIDVKFKQARPLNSTLSGPVDWLARFEIDCYARAKDTQGDAAVDVLVFAVYQHLRAGIMLGAQRILLGEPDIEFEVDEFAEKTGWAQLAYTVNLRTNNEVLDQ